MSLTNTSVSITIWNFRPKTAFGFPVGSAGPQRIRAKAKLKLFTVQSRPQTLFSEVIRV